MTPGADWLARGGTYYVLAFVWIASALFYYFLATKLGHQAGRPNDGCLYGICNIVLAFFGGGAGFLALIHDYPYFILSSTFGAIAFPSLGTLYFISRVRHGR
jgi:hypothetical protein